MIPNKLFLFLVFTVVILLVASTTLSYVFNYERSLTITHKVTNTNISFYTSIEKKTSYISQQQDVNTAGNAISIKDYTYKLAVKKLENILEEARDIYLNALKKNETWKILIYEVYSNFSKMFILNTTVVNETTLFVGYTVYKYIIVHVYDAESKLNFMPQRIRVNSIFIELLPRNRSITYTGIVHYDYLVRYCDKTYKVSFASMGFVEATKYLIVSTDKVSDSIYKVRITVARKLGSTAYVDVAWLILVRR